MAVRTLGRRRPARRRTVCPVGICAAGGSTRAAAISLGALQVLRATGWMGPETYLCYVDEGVGVAAALQQECSTVVVIDPDDGPPTLPRDVELDDVSHLRPGTDPGGPCDRRLAAGAVVTGRVTYPSGHRGRLVLAVPRLTADAPEVVLAHAAAHPAFPHETVPLDDGHVEVYRQLGRHLGAHVVGTLLRLAA
ncbi:hypothetical protein [Actinomycetospora termitidis]|uniref:Uncharacterized protein n=1 Tax=Actinomycetospora termitidis TaxID=3053470 RepID=A0ABT7MG10_9PSEU|nr:hypothetical protein [Actinomycetospora sp. Odt1-22]MDL5159603.1 hypothetical protein [Actinomycetospora sp. Odt1-22]